VERQGIWNGMKFIFSSQFFLAPVMILALAIAYNWNRWLVIVIKKNPVALQIENNIRPHQ